MRLTPKTPRACCWRTLEESRVADIPPLVEYFIDRFGKKAGKKFRTIDKKSLRLLQAYDWPGNIRELQNVIERAVILCEGETFSVDETWLRRELPVARSRPSTLNRVLLRQEKEMIEAALEECYGRISGPSGAAMKLGLPARTLDSKIKRFKISKYRFKVPRASLVHSAKSHFLPSWRCQLRKV
jgi:formate hydrogenlyase transcriptional activator